MRYNHYTIQMAFCQGKATIQSVKNRGLTKILEGVYCNCDEMSRKDESLTIIEHLTRYAGLGWFTGVMCIIINYNYNNMRSTTFVFSGSLSELREEQKRMIEESEKKRLNFR
jgi:hypothetical protein